MEPDRLRSVPILAELDEEDLLELAKGLQLLRLGADKIVTFKDEHAFKFFVILEGRASVSQEGRRIGELGPGDFFGEVGLLGEPTQRRTATVTTESETELAVFMQWDLRALEERWPSVGQRIRDTLNERLEADQQRLRPSG